MDWEDDFYHDDSFVNYAMGLYRLWLLASALSGALIFIPIAIHFLPWLLQLWKIFSFFVLAPMAGCQLFLFNKRHGLNPFMSVGTLLFLLAAIDYNLGFNSFSSIATGVSGFLGLVFGEYFPYAIWIWSCMGLAASFGFHNKEGKKPRVQRKLTGWNPDRRFKVSVEKSIGAATFTAGERRPPLDPYVKRFPSSVPRTPWPQDSYNPLAPQQPPTGISWNQPPHLKVRVFQGQFPATGPPSSPSPPVSCKPSVNNEAEVIAGQDDPMDVDVPDLLDTIVNGPLRQELFNLDLNGGYAFSGGYFDTPMAECPRVPYNISFVEEAPPRRRSGVRNGDRRSIPLIDTLRAAADFTPVANPQPGIVARCPSPPSRPPPSLAMPTRRRTPLMDSLMAEADPVNDAMVLDDGFGINIQPTEYVPIGPTEPVREAAVDVEEIMTIADGVENVSHAGFGAPHASQPPSNPSGELNSQEIDMVINGLIEFAASFNASTLFNAQEPAAPVAPPVVAPASTATAPTAAATPAIAPDSQSLPPPQHLAPPPALPLPPAPLQPPVPTTSSRQFPPLHLPPSVPPAPSAAAPSNPSKSSPPAPVSGSSKGSSSK
ncbi:hypothetical protein HDU67_010433, partial [Dinochytrium kinnereticum]